MGKNPGPANSCCLKPEFSNKWQWYTSFGFKLRDLNRGGSPKNKLEWCKKEGCYVKDVSPEMHIVNTRWLQKAKECFKFMNFAKGLIPGFAMVLICDDGRIS